MDDSSFSEEEEDDNSDSCNKNPEGKLNYIPYLTTVFHGCSNIYWDDCVIIGSS